MERRLGNWEIGELRLRLGHEKGPAMGNLFAEEKERFPRVEVKIGL
jgi:hypothetical protein